jgi:hypothetical protein
MNAGATFQREMDISFKGLIGQSMVVYLDDITVYSKKREDHPKHLRQIFERCRKYGISLNPKKTIFIVSEGILLGHIISKDGISVDPERTKSILQIAPPHSKRSMQSFFDRINFVRRFVPYFAEIVKPLQKMIKKDMQFKWTPLEKEAFENIKTAIANAPSLQSPDFSKDFLLYTFTSDHSLAAVLTQKDEQGDEYPVTFMSTGLQGVELNYPLVDKQAFVVHKAIKQFRPYILKNHTKVIVPHPEVRSMFVQKELGERRGNWMTTLQEYDLEFKPANIVKGQGLCKLVTQGADIEEQEEDGWQDEPIMYTQQVPYVPAIEGSCYNDLKYYLQYGTTPDHLNAKKKRAYG